MTAKVLLTRQLEQSLAAEEEKKLAETARDSLFNYQKLLLDADDEDWRILYRMRVDLANFIAMRRKRNG